MLDDLGKVWTDCINQFNNQTLILDLVKSEKVVRMLEKIETSCDMLSNGTRKEIHKMTMNLIAENNK